MSHTPGPWRVFDTPLGVGVTPKDGEYADIARCDGFDSTRTPDEVRANAHLIAAAPDMLAALKFVDERGNADDFWNVLHAAIAKAEGRT